MGWGNGHLTGSLSYPGAWVVCRRVRAALGGEHHGWCAADRGVCGRTAPRIAQPALPLCPPARAPGLPIVLVGQGGGEVEGQAVWGHRLEDGHLVLVLLHSAGRGGLILPEAQHRMRGMR